MSSRRESDFARLEQLLAETQAKTQRAEEQVRREQQDRQRAEEQAQRAEEQAQRAEEQAQRAEEQVRREQQDRQRAEEQVRREQQDRQRAEEQARRAEGKTRPTSFTTYLNSCHTLLYVPLRVQHDKSQSTKGSITGVKDKPCPTFIKPWKEFPEIHRDHFQRVSAHFSPNEEHFSSLQYLEEHGQNRCSKPIASERDLELHQHVTVEEPITAIISKLQENEAARRDLSVKYGIEFENHPNTLSDENEEVQEGIQNLEISRRPTTRRTNSKPGQADRMFVYKTADGSRKLCMLIEYKAPHKVSIANLRAGLLRADKDSLNIYKDVINRATIPNSPDPKNFSQDEPHAKFNHRSEWLVAAIATQTYGYMITSGLEYSYFTQGEAYIAFRIRKREPHTLYYHLIEPKREAHINGEEISLCYTAISQALTICLLALGSTPYNHAWRESTLKSAHRATIDPEMILSQLSEEERESTPSPSAFLTDPENHSPFVERSPINLRKNQTRKTCASNELQRKNPQNPNDSSDEAPDADTPSKRKTPAKAPPSTRRLRSHTKNTKNTKGTKDTSAEKEGSQERYCTQECLLGLVQRRLLDETCPNVDAHRVIGFGNHHAIDQKTFTREMLRQLDRTLDEDCEPLGKQGARGALFRLTLQSYGYVFVAKGTVLAFTRDLKHEARVYHHLQDIQGDVIPVYLGSVDLKHCYFLDVGVRIVHMLLMSWGGEAFHGDSFSSLDTRTRKCVKVAKRQLEAHGVKHCDIRPPNVLRDPNTDKVMLIDFERSVIEPQRQALKEISNQTRKRPLSIEKTPFSDSSQQQVLCAKRRRIPV